MSPVAEGRSGSGGRIRTYDHAVNRPLFLRTNGSESVTGISHATSLYRFYDAEDRLLYVGVTSVGPSRWREHEQFRAWWRLVVRSTVEHFDDRPSALAAERAAILAEKPLHNTQGTLARTPRPAIIRAYRSGSMSERSDHRWQVAYFIGGRRRYWMVRSREEAELLLAVLNARHLPATTREKAVAILRDSPRGATRD
jgi:hypothetical protein